MKKLVRGVVDFRESRLQSYRENFAHLALAQKPDALFIACSDSRVVPNTFASTDPGDLFVVRNVGNLVCPCGHEGLSVADVSEFAAIEFALNELHVSDIVVCGHSECGAMRAIAAGLDMPDMPHLHSWLRHGEPALARLRAGRAPDQRLSQVNQLSQLNVLLQLEHLRTYDVVRHGLARGTLRLHAWWFDLATADVYSYDARHEQFRILDGDYAQDFLKSLESAPAGD